MAWALSLVRGSVRGDTGMWVGPFRLLQLLLWGFSSGISPLDQPEPARAVDPGGHEDVSDWEVTPELSRDGHRLSLEDARRTLPSDLRLSLVIGRSRVQLDLQHNSQLIPESHSLSYYLPNGSRVTERDPGLVNCYYHGQTDGQTGTWSSLSLCSGIRGFLSTTRGSVYSIEPVLGDPSYRHLVRLNQGKPHRSQCGNRDTALDQTGSRTTEAAIRAAEPHYRIQRDVASEIKYVELVMVADNAEFKMLHGDMKQLHIRILETANRVDAFYRPLNVRVVLVSVEVWNENDQIGVSADPAETLTRFLTWREKILIALVPHDNAQLLTGVTFNNSSVGMATMGSMCTADRSGGVNMDHSVSILAVASTVAHELGHNLGLSHDTDRKCGQPRKGKKWIMEPSAGFLPGLEFSNCSLGDLEFSLRQGWANCLFNVPSPKSVFGTPQCGNLLVEDGEQCDCGLAQDCTDPCCDASTCQLHPGAQCSSDGQCCEGCKLRASGSLCRQPVGECDLPEYCNGVSPHCPPNVFLQNGETCDGGQAYCYQGKCHTLQQQCQDLWGPGSSSAPEPCFTKVNIRGDKYGNCGRAANGSYLSCSKSDVWCGKLQCQGGSARSRLGASAQIVVVSVTVNGSELACRGTHFNTEDDIWDSALLVTTGTPCGAGKVCVAQRCVDVSALRVGRCSNKCNGNGVCNSNNNCHCHPGWAPPDCVSSGQGGSVDSGSIAVKRDHSSLTAAILVICLVVVPLCSLLGFCYTRRDSLQRRFNKFGGSNKCQYRVTQSSSQPRPQRPPPPNWEQSTELQVMSSSYKGPERPDPPSRPLPPDPVPKLHQADAQDRPPPPTRPLPADPTPRRVQAPGKPPPPKKPLPTDPVSQTPLLSVPTYPSNMMAPPTRLAPPPPHSERTLQL